MFPLVSAPCGRILPVQNVRWPLLSGPNFRRRTNADQEWHWLEAARKPMSARLTPHGLVGLPIFCSEMGGSARHRCCPAAKVIVLFFFAKRLRLTLTPKHVGRMEWGLAVSVSRRHRYVVVWETFLRSREWSSGSRDRRTSWTPQLGRRRYSDYPRLGPPQVVHRFAKARRP